MTNWVRVCSIDEIETEAVHRFDHLGETYAIYRDPDGNFHATHGLCTHEEIHLADGLVIDFTVECPKHGGIFDYRTGEAMSPPVCVDLQRYAVVVDDRFVYINVTG